MQKHTVGQIGEELASKHLTNLGYEIVKRNFRTRFGELDIIAAGREELVFCEVKTRTVRTKSEMVNPLERVNSYKCRQIRKIAVQWLSIGSDHSGDRSLRFDVIGILLDPIGHLIKLEHIEGAF